MIENNTYLQLAVCKDITITKQLCQRLRDNGIDCEIRDNGNLGSNTISYNGTIYVFVPEKQFLKSQKILDDFKGNKKGVLKEHSKELENVLNEKGNTPHHKHPFRLIFIIVFISTCISVLVFYCYNLSSNKVESVDLGLSVNWADRNVGADSQDQYGNLYAWGEIMSKSEFNAENYNYEDNPTTLPSDKDIASVKFGSKWRMPTRSEMEELVEKCNWTWTHIDSIEGYKVTGPNGNSIFLPAGGCSEVSEMLPGTDHPLDIFEIIEENAINANKGANLYCMYWTSSLSGGRDAASYLVAKKPNKKEFNDINVFIDVYLRYIGRNIRPVCNK